jgi:filamentous hemagglutinin family protein
MSRKPTPIRRKTRSALPERADAGLFRLAPLAMAVAGLFATPVNAASVSAPFQSMVAMQAGMIRLPDGSMSQWRGADRPTIGTAADGRALMSIQQTQKKALLDWEKFELQANEILEFRQQQADWIAVNRVHSDSASRVDGEIRATGRVFILNDNGVLMGEGATINTRQLVTGRGVKDVEVDGNTTTIVQSRDKAVLNWSDMSLDAGEVLKFQQQRNDWIALNRSLLSGKATEIKGDVKADGHLLLVSRNGLHLDGKIEAQQLIASSLDIRDSQFLSDQGLISAADDYNDRYDPTFSNSWKYKSGNWYAGEGLIYATDPGPVVHDPNDPLRYNVTVGANGVIDTTSRGKVMLFGPEVTNRGIIRVKDEGQVLMVSGDNIYLQQGTNGKINAFGGIYNPLPFMRINVPYRYPYWRFGGTLNAEWLDFFNALTAGTNLRPTVDGVSRPFVVGDTISSELGNTMFGRIVAYVNEQQAVRAEAEGFRVRNEGIISSQRGGSVEFKGWNLEQMGAVEMTSTALFRGSIGFTAAMFDWAEYANGGPDNGPLALGNGKVVFGEGSLTQITPDLDSTDRIPVSEGNQSVGSLNINARSVHMQEDALIYMPSGNMNVLLDAGANVFSNRGNGGNTDNEDGSRFMMDRGATIDLSGWETTLEMGYHQVTGKLFAAQLKDSPLQRDGALYRKEITVDRRYGTNLADWESFDNLNQGTLAQFLVNGGKFTMDVADDFIMKQGSVIDVSGGKITYKDGFVYTTLLRRLDGSVIDIREANPDELYMGLANQWVVYDTKWGNQQDYYIPLMSSARGKYETSYEHGGKAGSIEVLAPDVLLQGTLKGSTTIGRYQRSSPPAGGVFRLNQAGESEGEYVSNNLRITAIDQILENSFGMTDKLSEVFGDFFGEEFDYETDTLAGNGRLFDNGTLLSAEFFDRSSMGSYELRQDNRIDPTAPLVNNASPPQPGVALVVDADAHIRLANGASLSLTAGDRMQFLGSVRTEGGDIAFNAASLEFGAGTVLDTRGSWYSDYELDRSVDLTDVPRINGGNISISATGHEASSEDIKLILPDTMVIDASGGAWVDRSGKLKAGQGGDLNVTVGAIDDLDLSGLDHARAYGLGGNGGFSLGVGQNIYIGNQRPEDDPASFLLNPEFFEGSGFSRIALSTSKNIVVQEGIEVNASSATLRLKDPTLSNTVPSAYYAPSGTDIYDIAEPGLVAVEHRPSALRDGMGLAFSGNGSILVGQGSVLATEAGGSISLGSNDIDVHGTILAPAGVISLGGNVASNSNSEITLHETARLLAQGAVRILDRRLDSGGRELIDGEVLDGGSIGLSAASLEVKQGAVLDVSGTVAEFDLAVNGGTGVVARVPRTVASNGGGIGLTGVDLDIDSGTYRAHAGGSGAKGGVLSVTANSRNYGAVWPGGATTPPRAVSTAVNAFNSLRARVYLRGSNTRPTTLYGIDLNTIDWGRYSPLLADLVFPEGFRVANNVELTAMLQAYEGLSAGNVPLLVIGSNLGDDAGVVAPAAGQRMIAPLERLMTLPNSVAAGGAVGGPAYVLPVISDTRNPVTHFDAARALGNGGFSEFNLSAADALYFSGDVALGGKNGSEYQLDRINLSTARFMADDGAKVSINAGVVELRNGTGGGGVNGAAIASVLGSTPAVQAGTTIDIEGGKLLQVENASFRGFSDVNLKSQGDIRLVGSVPAQASPGAVAGGELAATGNLTLKADQVYAATGRNYTVRAGDTLTVLPQDGGTPINASPYEAAATLTLTAPRIVQGGTLRSPLGTINLTATDDGSEGAGTVTLLPGSLTSVSAEGKVIPYGVTSNGDTWIDPLTGLELTNLPNKAVNLTGETLDLQEGAVLDVQGGGDLYAWEFTPGIGGSTDWLTGYRNGDYDWVDDGSGIYAVIPGYDADIAPVGLGNASNVAVGEKIYLSGGSGLKEGYYTLLPARYALLPGAFRVTANHHYGSQYGEMVEGLHGLMPDGSSIQAGYRYIPGNDGKPKYTAQRASGYLVMPGDTLRMRSQYLEARANSFYLSEAFLKKALRSNRPLGEIPRIPLDGGSVVLDAGESINLDATLRSAAGTGGRGGFADIKGDKILVAGAGTDVDQYEDYLVLDSERLNSFGAESLLLGGVRRQGQVNLEIEVGASDIVIDNQGTALKGPELLFASGGRIEVKDGAVIETAGKISGSSGDLRLRPSVPTLVDTKGTDYTWDDSTVHGEYEQGALLRLSSSEQVDILRNLNATDALNELIANPAALQALNQSRAALGLKPIVPGGDVIIAGGARLSSSQSIALDATRDTTLAPGATLSTKQISASASRVSIGEVPAGTAGLVFSGGSLGTLAQAQDVTLKSYSSIDFHGAATLRADGRLALDSRQIRVLNAGDGTVTIAGNELALTNSNGGQSTAAGGNATLALEGKNIYLEGQDKWLSGIGEVSIKAEQRVIGRDSGALYVPGGLSIEAADLTADSGAQLYFDAQGDVRISSNDNADLPEFETLGAILGISGASVVNQGRIGLTGGTVNLRARSGDVTLADGSAIDVTSNVSRIFDIEVGVGGGTVNLVSDSGDIDVAAGAVIDVSGTAAGGDAGTLNTSAGNGEVRLLGQVKGGASEGFRSGSFSMLSRNMGDFAAVNSQLDQGGFRQARRFEVNQGDVDIGGTVEVQEFAVVANDGSINVNGTIKTTGEDGGRIQLSAAKDVSLGSGARLLARANSAEGSGGTVFLETVGKDGGEIGVGAGSVIDVSGTGEGGRTVRLRAPQINGSDVAIAPVAGTITGARSVIAEGFRVYEDVETIDQDVIDTVGQDATAFMTHAAAIQARLGSGITVAPGIELRSDGDMELVEDWDLHELRFGSEQSAGVLSLRAKGDLKINANLSDGFDGASPDAVLTGGDSWTLNLTAGANTQSPDSLAVLPLAQLAPGKGSIIVGGTPDTTEFYLVALPDGSVEHRLFVKDTDGSFLQTDANNPYARYVELQRDPVTGKYLHPVTNQPIDKDANGDYVDTASYGRLPLPESASSTTSGYYPPDAFYNFVNGYDQDNRYGQARASQWDNSTGYLVRTGTAGINLATGRDLVLKYRPSVIYTAGESAPEVEGFQAPTRIPLQTGFAWGPMSGYYTQNGGDIFIRAQGDVVGSASNQLPTGWLWRYGVLDPTTVEFLAAANNGSHHTGRDYEQLTWFVRFDRYEAGIGALGGGNIDIAAGGDVVNLSVNIPNTGRVSGGYSDIAPVLHLTGGGDLNLRAGGDIGTIRAYVADGQANLTAGGSFTTTDQVRSLREVPFVGYREGSYDIYSMLFTSSGQFRLQSGGDLNLDVVADPLNMEAATDNIYGGGGTYGPGNVMYYIGDSRNSDKFATGFVSYTDDARVDLFSAGGDVRIWNNYGNIALLNKAGGYMKPLHMVTFIGSSSPTMLGSTVSAMWPATVSAVAAAGNVEIKGGMLLAPSAAGNLELLARENVLLGYGTIANDPFALVNADAQNYFPGYDRLFMSQTHPEYLTTALNLRVTYGGPAGLAGLEGAGYQNGQGMAWNADVLPDLHLGDTVPARIYAAEGDVITTMGVNLPKQMWVQAGRHIYFPNYTLQHNNPNDLSLVRAGEGLYFDGGGQIYLYGPGRLEIETGRDFWIPSNSRGITSNGIAFSNGQLWRPDEKAADIAISTGYNQLPEYEAFEDAYFNPEMAEEIAEYLLADAGDERKLPIYLFDRIYARGNGSLSELVSPELAAGFVNYIRGLQGLPALASAADQTAYLGQAWTYWLGLPSSQKTPYDGLMPRMTASEAAAKNAKPEFYLSERREGLVNYVRRLQGLEALQTQDEQLAYLDEAWAYWQTLSIDYKTPMIRNAFFMELRTTGREANDVDSDRNNTTFRGYNAIAALFPGAQKRSGEDLAEGESRWAGDFETFASRIISTAGGKVEFMIPGGAFTLANVAARQADTGQPTYPGDRGNALRAGVITQDGGDVNIFSRASVTVNESRILTTKGGNVMIWSSYGDIAAGKGAKTSISPQFYDYSLDNIVHMGRIPAGLPTGAGIGTLATQPGVPPADVDLIAPNGIVDAGDAGLRVSGNFNVFAVQILGTDNIEVQGISTGLPVPPSAPPTSLNIDDAAAKTTKVTDALTESMKKARADAKIKGPSIIEVRVLGHGENCAKDRKDCEPGS